MMEIQLLLGLLISILPVLELRAGLPIVLDYATKNSLPILPFFLLVLACNILAIFLAFIFLDFIHERLLKIKFYEKVINKVLRRMKKKSDKLEKRINGLGFLSLMFFVSLPLPGTGAWTGAFLSWMLGLNRKKSTIAIAAGVVISGTIVLLISLGVFSLVF